MERGVTFPTWLVVFSQSQCTVPVGQSEQTVLVGSRDFVENEAHCCVPIRLLILCPKSMYSFCEEKVDTFEYVAE